MRYNHIGRHFCPKCGLRSPNPNYLVTDIDRKNLTFTISMNETTEKFCLINDNIVNIYNFAAAIALLDQIGLNYQQISKGFSKSKIVKTRLEEIQSGDLNITMLMAKGQNPIACARCYDYVAKASADNKGVIVLVDDKDDNIGNSESTCWLYDCDYSAFTDPSIKQIVFAGPRCLDHYLRAQMAGVDKKKIFCTPVSSEGANLLDTTICKNIYVLHELYRPTDAAKVKEALCNRGKGEV